MIHRFYKYIFLINVLVIGTAAVLVMLFFGKDTEKSLPVAITTPLLNADVIDASFCTQAVSAVIIDAKSGAVLYEKNAHKRLPMASTTKIMTALAVIENSSPDDIVTVSQLAAGTEGSSIYLEAGEKITVGDLLYGLLLESGNDAATALAEGVFGSVEECCKYMNERSHEMGLVNTSFSNPHGLDGEKHYTSAYELALITKHAMKNETFRQIVSTQSYVTKGEKKRYFSNHNRLLRSFEGAVGVKTGYTSKAGRCLVSAASGNGEEYIAVTLNDSLDWQDHKDMLTFAFENFSGFEIANKNEFVIRVGFDNYVPSEDVYITTTDCGDFSLNYAFSVNKQTAAVTYSTDNATLGCFALKKKESFQQ